MRLFFKRRKKTESLLFLLAKNATGFFVVFSVAAAVALLLPALFGYVPLSRVLEWREHLERAKDLMEKVQLNSAATLALVIALMVARNLFPHSKVSAKLEPLWKGWDKGSDWLKRLGFVITAVFCFSFTGAMAGNVVDTLQKEIRESDKIYGGLVWKVYLDLSAQLNIHAYESAWEEIPPDARQIAQRELNLNTAAESVQHVV